MANALYNKAREKFLTGNLNWLTAPVKVLMVDTATYTFSGTHEFLSSISAASRITEPVLLIDKTATDGAADAKDATFAAVAGPTIEALVIYAEVLGAGDLPDDTASVLIAYIDSATGLPITPNGGDVIVTWDNGVNRIFRL
jgi:hypothetical protein